MKPLKESFIKAKDLDNITSIKEIDINKVSFEDIKCGDLIVTESLYITRENDLRILIGEKLCKKIFTNFVDSAAFVRYDKNVHINNLSYLKLSSFKKDWPNSAHFKAVKYYKTNIDPDKKFRNREDLIEWLKTYENKLNIQ